MFTVLVSLMVIICIALVVLILSQASKGGGLSGLVGDTATDMMGSHSASDLVKKLTRILAAAFMLISLLVGMMVVNQNKHGGAVKGNDGYSTGVQKEMAKQSKQSPAPTQTPAPTNMPASGGNVPPTSNGK